MRLKEKTWSVIKKIPPFDMIDDIISFKRAVKDFSKYAEELEAKHISRKFNDAVENAIAVGKFYSALKTAAERNKIYNVFGDGKKNENVQPIILFLQNNFEQDNTADITAYIKKFRDYIFVIGITFDFNKDLITIKYGEWDTIHMKDGLRYATKSDKCFSIIKHIEILQTELARYLEYYSIYAQSAELENNKILELYRLNGLDEKGVFTLLKKELSGNVV